MLCGPTFGLGTTFQLVPSKCSIKVSVADCCGGACGVEKPTAHTSFGASASTAFNSFAPWPMCGVAALTQLVPFQWIARGSLLPVVRGETQPTAQASLMASAE